VVDSRYSFGPNAKICKAMLAVVGWMVELTPTGSVDEPTANGKAG
jgi:hypothetical protein